MSQTREQQFLAALAQFIREHMPWPYSDVDRDSDEATDAAVDIAKKHAPGLWNDMASTEAGER